MHGLESSKYVLGPMYNLTTYVFYFTKQISKNYLGKKIEKSIWNFKNVFHVPLLSFSNGSWCNSDGGHGTAVWWWWWWLSWWCTWWCPSMPWCSPALPSCTPGWWNDAVDACCSATLWWSEPVDDTKSCRHRLGSVRFSRRSIIFVPCVSSCGGPSKVNDHYRNVRIRSQTSLGRNL